MGLYHHHHHQRRSSPAQSLAYATGIVRSKSTLAALCPVRPDATIFADSSLASTFLDTFQQEIKFDRLEVLIVRSPCSTHNDGQGGFLSLEGREPFEQHAKCFARFALNVTILKTGTTFLQLHGVTRQKLLASCEQLCAYCVDISDGGEWVNIKEKNPELGASKNASTYVCLTFESGPLTYVASNSSTCKGRLYRQKCQLPLSNASTLRFDDASELPSAIIGRIHSFGSLYVCVVRATVEDNIFTSIMLYPRVAPGKDVIQHRSGT